jgi:iron complex outermembrane receptor protein
MIRTVLSKLGFTRSTLAASVGIPFLIASSAFAQGPSPAEVGNNPAPPLGTSAAQREATAGATPPTTGDIGAVGTTNQPAGAIAQTERIIVTGSNIPTAEEVGPNPVLNINRDLINKSGERTAEQLILQQPVANAGSIPVSNNATGFTPGATAVALRGFDARATLVLIDGRRVAPYPVGIVGIVFVDLNSIPEAAIQSIEILKDGASTTYGADAVAGVVNIKLRKDYHGVEASVEYGNTLDKDSSEFKASVLFGIGDGNTNVSGVVNFYHRNGIFNRDRGLSAVPPFLSTNSSPENLQVTFESVAAAGAAAQATAAGFGPGDVFFAHAPFGSNGLTPATDYIYTAGRSSLFNFNQFSSSLPDSERYGGYVNFDHKWFGDQVVLYGDMFYQNVKTHNELAPSATGSFQTAGQVTLAIPPNMPLGGVAPPGTPGFEETGLAPDAFNPFNPFNQIISGGSRARLAEFGNRLFDNETDAFLSTIGVKGDKLFDGSWGYDAAFRYSQVKNNSSADLVSTSRYNRILNAADPIFNPDSPEFIGTTVPYNPFGDFRNPIPSNQAPLAFASVRTLEIDYSKLATLDFTMYSTELFKLPAGGVGFAAGGQFRRENIDQSPDILALEGDLNGSSPSAITHGGRKSFGIYAETDIPLFSPTNAIPGFYALEFTAAGRYEEFENNNTNVLVPKVGLRWQPLDESLTLRATWGEGFREPSLYELYAAPTSSLQTSHDPQNLDEEGNPLLESETPTLTTSNPQLQPEDSRAFAGGIVYTPKFVPGLTLSADFWDIERTGVVNAPTPDQVLEREANGALLPGERVERDAGGFISRITISNQNSGAETARGVDLGLQYRRETPWGVFTSYTNASYLDAFLFQQVAGGETTNFRGQTVDEGSSPDGYLKWKGRSVLDWSWNGFDVTTTVRYTDGFHEHKPNALVHWVSQTWFVDAQATYDFTFVAPVENQPVAGYSKDAKDMARGKDGKPAESSMSQTSNYSMPIWQRVLNGTSITLGCNDVFGEDPPTAYGEGGNSTKYPGFLYDATGRFVYVQLTKKF